MTRVLVKTKSPLWLINAADPDGKKVRSNHVGDNDQVFENIIDAQEALSVLEKVHGRGSTNGDKAERPAPQTTISDTGKVLVGKTITIKCSKRGCKNTRTIKPQDKFQVKFCIEHQEEHRKELRRERQRARAAAKREQAQKSGHGRKAQATA